MSKLKVNEIYKHSGSQVTIVDALSTAAAVTLGAETTFKEDVIMDKDLGITGNLNVVGTATISGGAINIGDADSDRLNIRADLTSNILPDASNTYDLGSPGKKWNYVHASTLSATAVSVTSVDSSTGNFTTDVTVGGTVDGRDVSVDGTALDVVKAASGTWDAASALSQTNETTLDAGSANWSNTYTAVHPNSASWSAAGTLSQTNETTLDTNSANWDSTYNQVQDASTDLNVDSGTLFVDKSENKVGILTTSPGDHPAEKNDLVIGNATGHHGITIASGPGSISTIRLAYDTVDGSLTTDEGWIDYHNTSKKMRFGTDGLNTRVTIDATGKVGIGMPDPADHPDEKNDLVIGNATGNHGITIASGNTSIGTIRLAYDTTANNGEGWIDYSNNSKKMRFGTDGLNTRVTIDATGQVGIGEGTPTEKLTVAGTVSAQGFKTGGGEGVTGTFVDNSSNTITVKNGIITSLL